MNPHSQLQGPSQAHLPEILGMLQTLMPDFLCCVNPFVILFLPFMVNSLSTFLEGFWFTWFGYKLSAMKVSISMESLAYLHRLSTLRPTPTPCQILPANETHSRFSSKMSKVLNRHIWANNLWRDSRYINMHSDSLWTFKDISYIVFFYVEIQTFPSDFFPWKNVRLRN